MIKNKCHAFVKEEYIELYVVMSCFFSNERGADMGIIFKLTLRYLKKNKKRTRATILGIACTMIILTTISLFTNTLMGMIRESIREDQGSWHLIFDDLNQEQYESLKENKKLCNVSETECVE